VGFSDEEAVEGLAITEELRAVFQRPAAASSTTAVTAAQSLEFLSVVPPEILSIILTQLGIRDLACLAATCRLLWCDAPTPPLALPTPGLVETELRRRAEASGLHIGASLPEGALSWVTYLMKREFYDALRRQAPLAAGYRHSLCVDMGSRLHLACHREEIKAGEVGEPLLGHDWGSDAGASTVFVPPTLVPSMHDTRIVSVASGDCHCLALSAVGEVTRGAKTVTACSTTPTGARTPGRGGSRRWRGSRASPLEGAIARRWTIADASSPGVVPRVKRGSRPVWAMSSIQRRSAS